MEKKPLLFGLRDYAKTTEDILTHFEREGETPITKGELETQSFPDGERYHRLIQNPLNRDVVLVCGTPTDAHFMDLMDVACAAQKYGARSLTLIVPYLGYSTMERKTKNYEVVKAKVRARMLSAIPRAKMGNSIIYLDLHSEGIPYYTEGDICGHHIYSENILIEAIRATQKNTTKLCIASTDAGRAKWVQSIANRLKAAPAFCTKTRISGTKTRLEAASNAAQGRHTVIFDDMIRTGGSLIDAVDAYVKTGAKSIDVACTHGLFPNNSHRKILESKKVNRILVSDSLPHVYQLKAELPDKLRERFIIMPYAPVWAGLLKNHLELP